MQHDWIPSPLGHGETMCSRCKVTNREAAAVGMTECDVPLPVAANDEAKITAFVTQIAEPRKPYDGGYCDRCNNTGTVDCHCGGDLCFCENQGEKECPRCHGECWDQDDNGEEY